MSRASQPTAWIIATLDTKGTEAAFVLERLAACGVTARVIDAGCLGSPAISADVTREELFTAAGASHAELVRKNDRGKAVTTAARGAAAVLRRLHDEGQVSGVIGLGGSAGTTIASAAMRTLPIGVPKIVVSTLASGQTRHYVADKDIFMLNAVVDISGLNRLSRQILDEAALSLAGMITFDRAPQPTGERPLVAATMFGVTTPCIERARRLLEEAGYEVLVFHATGAGGQAMESLIADGLIAGVLDITTTELADELVGGFLTAGPERLTVAGRRGVPQVVSVGATDMVNFHAPESVPERFRDRKFYQHNASVTLMRTTADECRRIGADIGRKLSQARGPASILFPLRGVSAIDRESQPFDDPAARNALLESVRASRGGIELVELDRHINDPEFADAAAQKLLELMKAKV